MATFIKGILGGISGKVGTVIGANWRGIDYIRSLSRKSNKPRTQPQLDVQFKFNLVGKLLRPVVDLINRGFKSVAIGKTPMNAAIAFALENAVTGISPAFSINFSKVKFTQGSLRSIDDPEVHTDGPSTLKFTWKSTTTGIVSRMKATDLVSLLVYNPVEDLYVQLDNAAVRSALEATIVVPMSFSGDDVHCYLSLASADGKLISDSTYLGLLPVM